MLGRGLGQIRVQKATQSQCARPQHCFTSFYNPHSTYATLFAFWGPLAPHSFIFSPSRPGSTQSYITRTVTIDLESTHRSSSSTSSWAAWQPGCRLTLTQMVGVSSLLSVGP